MNKSAIIFFIVFISCNAKNSEKKAFAEKQDSSTVRNYEDWKIAKGNNIEFRYPKNWQLKINRLKGIIRFGLTDDSDTSTIFFPVEIWEFNKQEAFNKQSATLEDFSAMPHQYFEQLTDRKRANLLNLIPTKFHGFEAKKYEFDKEGFPVNIITVDGIENFYMLIDYKEDSVSNYTNEIFKSINISSE